jgi:hypothetical protein
MQEMTFIPQSGTMNLASVVYIFFANEANDLFIVRNAVGNSGRKQVRNNLKKFANPM